MEEKISEIINLMKEQIELEKQRLAIERDQSDNLELIALGICILASMKDKHGNLNSHLREAKDLFNIHKTK